MLEALMTLGAASVLHGSLDASSWRAYESVEEAWIRDRHLLLIKQNPAVAAVAQIDLELKLAELHRRGIQFRHLLKSSPSQLRGGVWQLSWLPVTEKDSAEMLSADASYRRQDARIRELSEKLRNHPDHQLLRYAQTHSWKTIEYKEIHRRYSGRMQELNKRHGALDSAEF